MWLVRKATNAATTAASKVYQMSANALKEETPAAKLVKDIISSQHDIMPLRKMGELARQSYDATAFEHTYDFITEKLQDIKMQKKSLRKRLNLLVLVAYLIKHGATAFVDEFREVQGIFERYQGLEQDGVDEELAKLLIDIGDRAKYIVQLLNNKDILWREKEVARLVKEKLALAGGDFSTQRYQAQPTQNKEETDTYSEKVEIFLEKYVWKYTNKVDQKLDQLTDKLIEKIDAYLDGEAPESFEIDELEEEEGEGEGEKMKTEGTHDQGRKEWEQKMFMKQKLKKEDEDLLQFDAPKASEVNTPTKPPKQSEQQGKVIEAKEQLSTVPEKRESAKEMEDNEIEEFRRQLEGSPGGMIG